MGQSEEPDVFRYFIVWSLGAGIPITVGYAFLSSVLGAALGSVGDYRVGIHLAMVIIAIPSLVAVGWLHANILNTMLDQHSHFPLFNKVSTVPFSSEALRYYRWRVPIILFPIAYLIVITLFGILLLFPSELTNNFFVVGLDLAVPMSVIYVVAAIRYLGWLYYYDSVVYPKRKIKEF